ncbi:superoxide dismutase, Ni [Poseidonibacter lekithochrous]|uniref:superoxide dismutase, Ni n=1 Tax=Poseidonibacter lekithochrous TaxID=1904463 RepID=UPI0008FCA5E6|nr:superoxide dismutase, Ni [Poseidonibacter lekithochrous]QKJ23566.1 superoxide dismutase (Ni) [Poseidonibacter lekithochrous]
MFNIEIANAHCDVPCGIYDPISAQIAALSVIRMIDLMSALQKNDSLEYINTITRHISVKEEEAEKVKHEIRIIWGDFIKPPQIEQYPEIHTIVHNIMMLGSANRQHVSRDKAIELLEAVNKFAEIFWEIKGVEIKKVKANYLPNEEIVIPA